MTNHLPKGSEGKPFAVVCKWADWSTGVTRRGHQALIVEAADANEALLAANAARPDLWEVDGLTRETAVYPAIQLESAVD